MSSVRKNQTLSKSLSTRVVSLRALLLSDPLFFAKCLSQGRKVLLVISFKSCISLCHRFAYDVKQEEFEPRP
jgi:hypothetical protein